MSAASCGRDCGAVCGQQIERCKCQVVRRAGALIPPDFQHTTTKHIQHMHTRTPIHIHTHRRLFFHIKNSKCVKLEFENANMNAQNPVITSTTITSNASKVTFFGVQQVYIAVGKRQKCGGALSFKTKNKQKNGEMN